MSASDWLTAPLVTLAYCWRIERRDGRVLGFTTHDLGLWVAGEFYASAPGIRPSAIEQALGRAGDSLSISGAIDDATLREADLASGRFDGASVTLFITDWSAAQGVATPISRGILGAVSRSGGGFGAEIDAADPLLATQLVPETSPACRAELGDAACRVAMAGRRARAKVVAVSGRQMTIDTHFPDGIFAFGQMRWLSGRLRGLGQPIMAQRGAELTLARSAAPPDAPGWQVELVQGCDKSAASCATRFANIANFRGEPHLPGLDLLTRFGG